MSDRLTLDLIRLRAARAVHKVDLLGPRGTTLCSMDEIEAMACICALSGLLPAIGKQAGVNETPISDPGEDDARQ